MQDEHFQFDEKDNVQNVSGLMKNILGENPLISRNIGVAMKKCLLRDEVIDFSNPIMKCEVLCPRDPSISKHLTKCALSKGYVMKMCFKEGEYIRVHFTNSLTNWTFILLFHLEWVGVNLLR